MNSSISMSACTVLEMLMSNLEIERTGARVAPPPPTPHEGQASGTAPATLDQAQWRAFCQRLSKEALQGSGLSHDVFTGRYSEGVDRAIERLPTHHRLRALRLAKLSGQYSSPAERAEALRWNAANGCCSHGITLGYCPAGCDVPDDYEETTDDYAHFENESNVEEQQGRPDEHQDRLTPSPLVSRYDGTAKSATRQPERFGVRSRPAGQPHFSKLGLYLRLAVLLPIGLASLVPLVLLFDAIF